MLLSRATTSTGSNLGRPSAVAVRFSAGLRTARSSNRRRPTSMSAPASTSTAGLRMKSSARRSTFRTMPINCSTGMTRAAIRARSRPAASSTATSDTTPGAIAWSASRRTTASPTSRRSTRSSRSTRAVAMLDGGANLVSGADFLTNPRLSPDGRKMAWLEWSHPNMPWDAAEVWVGDVDAEGTIHNGRHIAGGNGSSVFQPEWTPGGASDLRRRPHRLVEFLPLPGRHDHAPARHGGRVRATALGRRHVDTTWLSPTSD